MLTRPRSYFVFTCPPSRQSPWAASKRSRTVFGKPTILATAATLSAAAVMLSTADARAYRGYYGYAPGFLYAASYRHARHYGYGGRTYDYYRRDFQLRGRNGE